MWDLFMDQYHDCNRTNMKIINNSKIEQKWEFTNFNTIKRCLDEIKWSKIEQNKMYYLGKYSDMIS